MSDDVLTQLARDLDDPDPLRALAASARLSAEVGRTQAALVRRARNRGATWAEIAAALGVTRQAVNRRYRGGLPGLRP